MSLGIKKYLVHHKVGKFYIVINNKDSTIVCGHFENYKDTEVHFDKNPVIFMDREEKVVYNSCIQWMYENLDSDETAFEIQEIYNLDEN